MAYITNTAKMAVFCFFCALAWLTTGDLISTKCVLRLLYNEVVQNWAAEKPSKPAPLQINVEWKQNKIMSIVFIFYLYSYIISKLFSHTTCLNEKKGHLIISSPFVGVADAKPFQPCLSCHKGWILLYPDVFVLSLLCKPDGVFWQSCLTMALHYM